MVTSPGSLWASGSATAIIADEGASERTAHASARFVIVGHTLSGQHCAHPETLEAAMSFTRDNAEGVPNCAPACIMPERSLSRIHLHTDPAFPNVCVSAKRQNKGYRNAKRVPHGRSAARRRGAQVCNGLVVPPWSGCRLCGARGTSAAFTGGRGPAQPRAASSAPQPPSPPAPCCWGSGRRRRRRSR